MANTSIASVELRRTLSFFEGENGVEPVSAPRSRSAAAPVKARGKNSIVEWRLPSRTPLLRARAITLLADKLDVEEKQLLQVSSITLRTYHRRQQNDEAFSETETDRVLRIARVAKQAGDVFGDPEKARRWLSRPNRMLGAMPLELLATDSGAHEVEAELNRIEMSDFA